MSISWLPKVEGCCSCVKDLKVACLIISILTILCSMCHGILGVKYPLCGKEKTGGNTILFVTSILLILVGVALCISAVLVLVHTFGGPDMNYVYVYCSFAAAAFYLIAGIIYVLAYFTSLKSNCAHMCTAQKEGEAKGWGDPGVMLQMYLCGYVKSNIESVMMVPFIANCVSLTLAALIQIYFGIVVNSYEG